MSEFGTSTRRTASVVLRYGLAVLSVAAALFIKELLRTYFDPTPNSLFFCAVVLSSWVGGLGPGLLASSLSVVLIDYQFKSPFYTLELSAEDLPRMVVFFLSAASISWLSASQKRARESLRQARDELDTKVQERTAELRRANEELQAEIGERKEAEVALRSSEAQLTQAQRIAHLGSYEIDVLAGTNRWSDEIFRLLGLNPQNGALARKDFVERIVGEDRQYAMERYD